MFKELNILKIFFENPSKEYGVREIARALNISPATASQRLQELYSQKVLRYRPDRTLDLYSADMTRPEYIDTKKYYSIIKLRESGIIDALNKEYLKPTIILFGSVSTGLDTETSDIDLVVISEKITEFKRRKEYEKKLGKEIQIINIKNLRDITNPHLINNILNGTTLQGEIVWISKSAKKKDSSKEQYRVGKELNH